MTLKVYLAKGSPFRSKSPSWEYQLEGGGGWGEGARDGISEGKNKELAPDCDWVNAQDIR